MQYSWTFKFTRFGGLRTLTNVQTAQFTQGRRGLLDTYNGGSGSLQCINPSQWTFEPEIGSEFYAYINTGGIDYLQFYGYVKDVRIDYGKVPAEDIATISVEDLIGAYGRIQLANQSIAQATTGGQASTLVSTLEPATGSKSTASAQTYTGSVLQYLNKLVATENGRMTYLFSAGAWYLYWLPRSSLINQISGGFSDEGIGANQLLYDQLQFGALSDNDFNKVVVNPAGLTSQAAGTGTRGYSVDTFDVSTAQALDNANYILNRFVIGDRLPIEISCTDRQQTYNYLHLINDPASVIGQKQTVRFRGKTWYVIIEGSTVTITPDQTRFTFSLSSQDLNAYLILNDSLYGKLDYNRLGF